MAAVRAGFVGVVVVLLLLLVLVVLHIFTTHEVWPSYYLCIYTYMYLCRHVFGLSTSFVATATTSDQRTQVPTGF